MLDRNDPSDSPHSKISEDEAPNLCVDVCGCVRLCATFEWRRRYRTTNEGAEPHVNIGAASRNDGNRSLMTSDVCAGCCKAPAFRCGRFIGGGGGGVQTTVSLFAGVPQVRTQATNKNVLKSVCGNRINNERSRKRAAALRSSFCRTAVPSTPSDLWHGSRARVASREDSSKPNLAASPPRRPFAGFYSPRAASEGA